MRQSGFIALTSVIIISILLLTITATIAMNGLFARFNVLDSQSKEGSLALAEGCVDQAKYNFANDHADISAQPMTITAGTCQSVSLADSGGQATIKSQAVINKAYSNLKVVINDSNFSLISWTECTNFSSC